MNKFAKALLLALIFAAPITVFTSVAQANIHHTGYRKTGTRKGYKVYKGHYKHYKHHPKKPTH
ncbi:MAG: hypothetical protein V7K48_31440 [Nostoc sp.]|uniref:hypothetical protein n=1 Tax=Nostoc sp. TaxID=1180 RepID=UPI002FFA7DBF